MQFDGYRFNIMANRYEAGSGWGTAQLIETDNAGNADFPQIAVDTAGNAIAIWQQFDGTRYNIWANRYETGTDWGTAQLITTDNTGWACSPQVAMDTAGNAIAVWRQSDGTSGMNIWANRYEAGSGWGTAQRLEAVNAGNARYPQVAVNAAGNAVAVWVEDANYGASSHVWANRYEAGKGWGTAQLQTDNADNASVPDVAVDAKGNAIAVWVQSDITGFNIWANRYEAGKGWGKARVIETSTAGTAAWAPHVAMDAAGNAVAVWFRYDGSTYSHIWANQYAAGKGWGKAKLLIKAAAWYPYPQVAMNAAGNAVAVWMQPNSTNHNNNNVLVKHYKAGKGWGAVKLIKPDNAGGDIFTWSSIQVAMNAAGKAVAVWGQYDGTRYHHIWAALYE